MKIKHKNLRTETKTRIQIETEITTTNPTPTIAKVQEYARQMDVSEATSKPLTLYYTSMLGNEGAGKIALGIANQHPENIGIIDNTEAGRLFTGDIFQNFVRSAVQRETGINDPIQLQNEVNTFFNRPSDGPWSLASQNMASGMEGHGFVIISPDAQPNRVFASDELRSWLNSGSTKTMNGLDRTMLSTIYNEQGVTPAMNKVIYTSGGVLDTLISGMDGNNKIYDTMEMLRPYGITGKTLPEGVKDIQRFGELFKEGGKYYSWWESVTPALRNEPIIVDAINKLGGKWGVVGLTLGFASTAFDAKAAVDKGDSFGASRILSEWGSGLLGDIQGGAYGFALGLPYARTLMLGGFPGQIAGGILLAATTIAGAYGGEEIFKKAYNILLDMELYTIEETKMLAGQIENYLFKNFHFSLFAIGDTHNLARDHSLNHTLPSVLYDDQQPGRKVAVRGIGLNDTFQIQVEQQSLPWNRQVSANTAVAMALTNSTLQISLQPRDVVCSTDGNDNIYASDTVSNLIYGGKDLGSVGFSSNGNVVLTGKGGNYSPSVGYFVKNTTAPYYNETVPIYGGIMFADVLNTPLGASFNMSADLPIDKLGYFMVPGSAGRTPNLRDGVNVTFQREWAGGYQQWTPAINGTALDPYCQAWGGGSGSPVRAVYSDTAFNRPGWGSYSYTDGTHRFSTCFNVVTLQDNVTETLVFPNYGDTITCGLKSDTIGYRMGDGVKRIRNFNASQDNVLIHGGTAQNVKLLPVPEGTFIKITPDEGNPGGMLIENTNTTQLAPRVTFGNVTETLPECGQGVVALYNPVRVDGKPLQVNHGDLVALEGGLLYLDQGNTYTVVTHSGDGMTARLRENFLDLQVFFSNNREPYTLEGTLISENGRLRFPNGTLLPQDIPASLLYGEGGFGDEWCVGNKKYNRTSLFFNNPNNNITECRDPNFRPRYETPEDYAEDMVRQARERAIGYGFNASSPFFNGTVLDILNGLNLSEGPGFNESDIGPVQKINVVNQVPTLPLPTEKPSTKQPTTLTPSTLPPTTLVPSTDTPSTLSPTPTESMTLWGSTYGPTTQPPTTQRPSLTPTPKPTHGPNNNGNAVAVAVGLGVTLPFVLLAIGTTMGLLYTYHYRKLAWERLVQKKNNAKEKLVDLKDNTLWVCGKIKSGTLWGLGKAWGGCKSLWNKCFGSKQPATGCGEPERYSAGETVQ